MFRRWRRTTRRSAAYNLLRGVTVNADVPPPRPYHTLRGQRPRAVRPIEGGDSERTASRAPCLPAALLTAGYSCAFLCVRRVITVQSLILRRWKSPRRFGSQSRLPHLQCTEEGYGWKIGPRCRDPEIAR